MMRFIALFFCLVLAKTSFAQFKGNRLGNEINSEFDELKPLLSTDGKTLYFVRTGHPENKGGKKAGQDIWYAQKDEAGNWQKAVNIGSPLNNRANNLMGGLALVDTTHYYFLGNVYDKHWRTISPGISLVKKTSEGWTKPEEIFGAGQLTNEGHLTFHVAPDLSVIILSMQKDKNQKDDLFFATYDGQKWSELTSLGDNINSEGIEIAPYLSTDKTTLYFASDGIKGEGNTDIYMAKRQDNSWTNWSKPVNLGKAVNTVGFDAYFAIDEEQQLAYFVSGDSAAALGDIYSIKLEDIEPLKEKPKDTTDVIVKQTPTKEESVKEETPIKEELKDTTALVVTEKEAIKEDHNDRYPNTFGDVLFNFNDYRLQASERKKVDVLINYLNKYPNLKVSLEGHTDIIGDDAVNDLISQARSESIKNYMVQKGIKSSRIKINHYGKRKPKAKNTTKEGRQQNRRVEFVILEK